MHLQPNRNYRSNDDVQTPLHLARSLVDYFQPRGHVLEPCAGAGAFRHALESVNAFAAAATKSGTKDERKGRRPALPLQIHWCEIKRGSDFFAWSKKVDWVITNPPWSQFREFLRHALEVADEVVFLVTINHLWTRARIRDITTAGFGLKEIIMVDTPATFPPLGFQLGAVHVSRGWQGTVTLTDWRAGSSDVERRKVEARRSPKRDQENRRQQAPRRAGKGVRALPALPSQWMSARELGLLTPQEHLRLILRAA